MNETYIMNYRLIFLDDPVNSISVLNLKIEKNELYLLFNKKTRFKTS